MRRRQGFGRQDGSLQCKRTWGRDAGGRDAGIDVPLYIPSWPLKGWCVIEGVVHCFLPVSPSSPGLRSLAGAGCAPLPACVYLAVLPCRGFALSIVKPRSLALHHEAGGSGTTGPGPSTAQQQQQQPAGGVPFVTGAMAVALEGVRVYVHSGAQQLAGNTRGAVGVVDAEYADMDGDEVSRIGGEGDVHC